MRLDWIDPTPVSVPPALRDSVGGHPLVAETLMRRGITTPDAARAFLDPDAYSPTPPDALPDMDRAVARLRRAIADREPICIWGDFDADGQTASALLLVALRALGADVRAHIPKRATEGHGIAIEPLKQRIADGARLILTCDTGIAAHDAIAYARAAGVETIVTDHHHLPPTLPDAYALINPGRLSVDHPLRTLPGVGVAYKLIEALSDGDRPDLLDLVAIGIVADVALQTGDTRYLLQRGLRALSRSERVGLRALYETAALKDERVNEEHIGFVIGPRLNAVGRLDDAALAVELLTTTDPARARTLAGVLEQLNLERRTLTRLILDDAHTQLAADPDARDADVILLSGEHWHVGVVGIVASKLVEEYGRPVVLLNAPRDEDGIARGSARSVEGVHLADVLAQHADLLLGFGGHAMAAGMSLHSRDIPKLRRALSRTVRSLRGMPERASVVTIAGDVAIADLTLAGIADLERLAPFGAGNPPLVLALRGVRAVETRTIGAQEDHRTVTLEDDTGARIRAVWWGGGDDEPPVGAFDLAFSARADDYQGKRRVQVVWIAARAAAPIDLYRARDLRVIDRRADANDSGALAGSLATDAETCIWREGDPRIPGVDRRGLTPARQLALLTAPPDLATLRAGLETVTPEALVLVCAAPAHADDPAALALLIAAMLKFVIRDRAGVSTLAGVAAASGVTAAIARLTLDWLAESRVFAIDHADDGSLRAAAGTAKHVAMPAPPALVRALAEAAAFRAYLRRANPAAIAALLRGQG